MVGIFFKLLIVAIFGAVAIFQLLVLASFGDFLGIGKTLRFACVGCGCMIHPACECRCAIWYSGGWCLVW